MDLLPTLDHIKTHDETIHALLHDVLSTLEQIRDALSPAKVKWTNVYKSPTLTDAGDIVTRGAAVVHGWDIYNTAASVRVVKIYDAAQLPTARAARPLVSIAVPTQQRATLWMPRGIPCNYGIAAAVTGGIGDYDNTATSAGDVLVNVFYENA